MRDTFRDVPYEPMNDQVINDEEDDDASTDEGRTKISWFVNQVS